MINLSKLIERKTMFSKLKKPSAFAFTLTYLTLLSWGPFFYSMFFEKRKESEFIFTLVVAMILLIPISLLRPKKIYFSLISFLIFVPSLIELGHIGIFNGRITTSLFFVIFDSTISESSEFIQEYVTAKVLVPVFIYVILAVFGFMQILKREYYKIEDYPRKTTFFIMLLLSAEFVICRGKLSKINGKFSQHPLTQVLSCFFSYQDELSRMSSMKAVKVKDELTNLIQAKISQRETVVLVLGESTNRSRMQLYGYERSNTPLLSKREDLLVLKNTFSTLPPSTLKNLQKILTFADRDTFSVTKLQISIVDIVKELGFKTFWYSNQLVVSKNDTMTTAVAKKCDVSRFTNTTDTVNYDEKLLPLLNKALSDPADKKFIVLHMIGSHSVYKNRYPENYQKFQDNEGIPKDKLVLKLNNEALDRYNHYDNSIFYQDYVLNEAINLIEAKRESSFLFYVSDHGEEAFDVVEFNGHTMSKLTRNMTTIPAIFWFSEDFKKLHLSKISDLQKRRESVFLSDYTIDTLLELIGVSFNQFQKKHSLSSSSFESQESLKGYKEIQEIKQ